MKQTQPRIIAGSAKSKKLMVPSTASPITDRMKQSLFDLIDEYIPESRVLDLFAGSGALGIEALSRGAIYCMFIEIEKEATTLISKNLASANLEERAEVVRSDLDRFLRNNKDTFDIVFADPPYDNIDLLPVHKLRKLMNEDSIAILKLPTDYPTPTLTTMPLLLEKHFGNNKLVVLGKKEPL